MIIWRTVTFGGLSGERKKTAYKETALLRELEEFLGPKHHGYENTAVSLRTLDNETRVFGTTVDYSLVPGVDNRHPEEVQIVFFCCCEFVVVCIYRRLR